MKLTKRGGLVTAVFYLLIIISTQQSAAFTNIKFSKGVSCRRTPKNLQSRQVRKLKNEIFQTMSNEAAAPQKSKFRYDASQDMKSVYHRMDVTDKKTPTVIGPVAFWATALIGVPFWFTVLLPFTIVSATANFIYVMWSNGKLFSMDRPPKDTPVGDGDEAVSIVPMESRKYDLVLLGASGFTGQLGATHLIEQYGVGEKSKIKWAIAGRSKSKLEKVLQSIAKDIGNEDALKVEIIVVDTNDRSTVKNLVKETRAVATSAGPFAKYGSSVVEYCAKYGTHYADITGEADWNKNMMKLYESTARNSGAKIVSFCGHDSVPWDLTVRFLSEKMQECGDELVSVECLDEAKGEASGGTLATVYDSIDRGINEFQWSDLYKKKQDLYMRLPDGSQSENILTSDLPLTVSPCRNPSERFAGRWCGPFVMAAVNMEIVRRSVALGSKRSRATSYREAIVAENFMDAFTMWFGLVMLGTLIINPVTQIFVKKVLPQPGEGPSKKVRDEGFLCVTGYGVGAKGNNVESAMYFPHDGGYKSTARMLVESGLCLALNEDRHEFSEGGFYSPAAIMCDALLDRLVETGASFAYEVKSK